MNSFTSSTRKSSRPSSPISFGRSNRTQSRSRLYGLILLACGLLLYIFYFRQPNNHDPSAAVPKVVIVVALDKETMSKEYTHKILQNRQTYADRWSYEIFAKQVGEYKLGDGRTARKFAKLNIIRHAMSTFPSTEVFWYLSSNALIMNAELDIDSHILSKKRLEKIMLKKRSIVPPESVIKTFGNLEARDAQFILTQDTKELSTDSFIIRRTEEEITLAKKEGKKKTKKKTKTKKAEGKATKSEFGMFLLDTWTDPLYRQYPKFPKGDRDALQHIAQWHPTILAKLALVPQRTMNSYVEDVAVKPSKEDDPRNGGDKALAGVGYKEGDFVVNLDGCEIPEKDCKETFDRFWSKAVKGTGD